MYNYLIPKNIFYEVQHFFFTIRQLKSTKNACHSIGKYFSCLIKKILRENKYDVHIHKYLGSLKACNRNIWAF